MTQKLSERQRLFVENYIYCLNATKAAKEAKYKHPRQQGSRLLRESKAVRAAIQARMDEECEKIGINRNWLLKELVEAVMVAKASVKPKLNSKTGKPIKDDDGNPIYTRNDQALLKALELIGKHIDVSAFDNKVHLKVSHDEELIAAIREGAKQAGVVVDE